MVPTKSLKHRYQIEITPSSPFNFDATFHKPDHFPSGDNEWQPGFRWQTMLWQNRTLGLVFQNRGTIESPRIRLSVSSSRELDQAFFDGLESEINYRFNLQMDLGNFYHRFCNDPVLGPVIHRWRGLRPMNYGSLYEFLMIAIVLQNATVRRSVNMLQALFNSYGSQLSYDDRILCCYWKPETMEKAAEQDLRDLKLGYRAKSIKRVTHAFVNNEINEFLLRDQPLEVQRSSLLGLYGIGPASVGYLLFDVFHQMDDMRHISPWEQKIYSRLFFDTDVDVPVSVEKLLDHFEQHFLGYRMLAVHYIWQDLFWKRKNESVDWLEKLIRL